MNNNSIENSNVICESKNLDNLSYIISIMSQSNRLHIICLLNKNKELCVCEIIDKLGIRQNLVSHHLSILKEIGLLKRRKKGKQVFYSINKKQYKDIIKQLKIVFNIN